MGGYWAALVLTHERTYKVRGCLYRTPWLTYSPSWPGCSYRCFSDSGVSYNEQLFCGSRCVVERVQMAAMIMMDTLIRC